MTMIKPNRVLIAEMLSSKIVLLFELCRDQLSKQSHYVFVLRALKTELRSAGNLKRAEQKIRMEKEEAKADNGADVPIIKMSYKDEESIY